MKKLGSVIVKTASTVGKLNVTTACLAFGYQPKVPTTLLKKSK